ncbi:MAG: tRNA uridine(34) 5-carboxymethylaminomethyl modification radical SAM/GNAT enzyme Elp3 [Deltaproteobacteria bacterium]|nr:tRNA uridine(34) 5-carboxymethylaminomethyl modification radical SAM/GNAT enzyme Elp3 [Deltaproteobacteria bacterium]
MVREMKEERVLVDSETGQVEHRAFDPEAYSTDLLAIAHEINAIPDDGGTLSPAAMDGILRRHPKDGRGFYSRAQIIAGLRYLSSAGLMELDEERLVRRMQMRPVRTQSGVTPLTVLTRPHPCPGKCVFCPNDVRMPKSYLADEPGAQRASKNHFDPYLQTWNRLAAYKAIGHPIDKIEMIILGGTWSFHPEAYQIWFIKRCFDALNDFGMEVDGRAEAKPRIKDFLSLENAEGKSYNETVGSYLRDRLGSDWLGASENASWDELTHAQSINESAGCRSVGLVVETRPDHISVEEIERIRRLGCTKVQIGFQSLSDEILKRNQRGHDVSATRAAMTQLRAAGFKLHAHWMPNLLGATTEGDKVDFDRIFSDSDLRPDELKVYPCSLIETAELMDHYDSGAWRPYTHDELLDVVVSALASVPRYCRVTRVIRDISSDDIVVGNKLTNFRQIAENELVSRGGQCVDVRSREVRRESVAREDLVLRSTDYETGIGGECFLEFVTAEDRLAGFARLSLPTREADISELKGSALLREVHVYGAATDIGMRPELRAQHRGLGSQLVTAAADRALASGFSSLAVISAVGTRHWYRRLGFRDGRLYQHMDL